MAKHILTGNNTEWKRYELNAFRFAFIYFFIQAFPLSWRFYKDLFTAIGSGFQFQDLFGLTTYMPRFFPKGSISTTGFAAYADWGIVLLIAAGGAIIWSIFDRDRKEYNQWYYWLRVLLRYRLAIAVIAFGIIKLFSIQLPPPTISDLHTNYGEFLPWKAYSLTTGVASAYYEPALGLIEILGGVLLLYRKTISIGAGLIAAFLINVLLANYAYEIGQQVYSAYLLVIAFFLIWYDTPRLFNLLVLQKRASANRIKPIITAGRWAKARVVLKSAFVVFILLLGVATYAGHKKDRFPFPENNGLAGAEGYYNVKEFILNNQERPYSFTDSLRWQDVVFEKWGTISIRSPQRIKPDLSTPEIISLQTDLERNYESAGNAGRAFYTYQTDTLHHKLSLQNKNKNYEEEKWVLQYNRPDSVTIVLTGVNQLKDSVHVVLNKVNRKYLLKEGRRKPIKI